MNNLVYDQPQPQLYYSPQKQSSASGRTFAEQAFSHLREDGSPIASNKKIMVEFATPDPKGDMCASESYANHTSFGKQNNIKVGLKEIARDKDYCRSPPSTMGGTSEQYTASTPWKSHLNDVKPDLDIFHSSVSSQDLDMEQHCVKSMESPRMSFANALAQLDQEMQSDIPEFSSSTKSKPTEYDRFIPQRQADNGFGLNFEKKELIFSEQSLACTHTAYEGSCAQSNSNNNQHQVRDIPNGDTDHNNQIFQTLLCSQLLQAENPHILSNGALNDQTEVDDEFLHHSRLLTTQYNALDFR